MHLENNRFWGLFDGNKCVGTTGTTAVTSDPTGQTGMIGYNFIEAEYRGHKYSDLFFEVGLTHALECKEWKMYITDHRDGNAVKS